MKKCSEKMNFGANSAQDGVQRGPPSRREFVELTEYCERKYHRIDSSIINLMSYISTGIFVWWLLRGICFEISFSSIEGMRIKEILNVAMYTAPYFFCSLVFIDIVIITWAVIQVGQLRSRMWRITKIGVKERGYTPPYRL
ncbi:hypothetical protein [Providencia rettgeri]|uniref:hypothetical protein n=1 Tax=Providencia rettgeri TaxID=587 RepID=UPI00141A44E2|nr:hypothetical protein [Providencia rettgeri]NIH07026.1 hypothetical protein [Providencia rettgeri]